MPLTPEIAVASTLDATLIRVTGKANFHISSALHDFALEALVRGDRVLVDLLACTYADSTFLGCLVGLHRRRLAFRRGEFQLVADQEARNRLFGATRLDQILTCRDTAPAVVGGLRPIKVQPRPALEIGRHVMTCHRRLAELGGEQASAFQSVADRLAADLESSP